MRLVGGFFFCLFVLFFGAMFVGLEVKTQNKNFCNRIIMWNDYSKWHIFSQIKMSFSFSLPIHMCRLQPSPAVVLHDLLHHLARAPRFPRHERVQEEVRLGMGRVLPNCSLPDHSPCLLRNPSWTLLSWGLFWPNILAVKTRKNPNMNGLIFRIFFLTQEFLKKILILDWRCYSTLNVLMEGKKSNWCLGLFEELPF